MPYAKVSEIYQDGREKGYGTPMINVINYEMIKWAVEAAEEEGMPILIGFFPGFGRNLDKEAAYLLTKMYADRAKVPVALHLDHSPSFEVIAPHLKFFDSVMIDGSSLSYEENLQLTAKVVEICHPMGVVVEAELGHVGSASSLDDIKNADHYTNVDQAAEFVERTGCDSLAIAIGNAHGNYVAMPNLDFDRLKAIRKAVSIPLVLHGGSGIPDDQFTECVRQGMSKFNIFTDYNYAYSSAIEKSLKEKGNKGAFDLMLDCADACRQVIRHKIQILNPKGIRVV